MERNRLAERLERLYEPENAARRRSRSRTPQVPQVSKDKGGQMEIDHEENPQNDDCSICLQPVSMPIVRLRCGHAFHQECFEKWAGRNSHGLLKHRACPTCRDPGDRVPPPPPTQQRERRKTKSRTSTAKKTDPVRWDKIVKRLKRSSKGGRPGEWSARKAQFAVSEYKKEMKSIGKKPYRGRKSRSNSLSRWTRQKWDYVDPKDKKKKRSQRGRYFPESVRRKLSKREKRLTNKRKRYSTKLKKQHSPYTNREARLVREA